MQTTEVKINCAWCGSSFVKRRPNMIYCQKDCCNSATNKKLIEKYHRDKARRKQTNRSCLSCGNKLSKYNADDSCYACQMKEEELQKVKLLQELGFEYILEDEDE